SVRARFMITRCSWRTALRRLVGVEWLQRVELASSIELIFGLILVTMMLYRRDGLIPATRRVAALSLDEQSAEITRGGVDRLQGLGALDASFEEPAAGPLLEIDGLTVRFG